MVKNPPANAGDTGLIPGSGRSPGVGNDNPLQYSCLGNPMEVHEVRESDTTEYAHTLYFLNILPILLNSVPAYRSVKEKIEQL